MDDVITILMSQRKQGLHADVELLKFSHVYDRCVWSSTGQHSAAELQFGLQKVVEFL